MRAYVSGMFLHYGPQIFKVFLFAYLTAPACGAFPPGTTRVGNFVYTGVTTGNYDNIVSTCSGPDYNGWLPKVETPEEMDKLLQALGKDSQGKLNRTGL